MKFLNKIIELIKSILKREVKEPIQNEPVFDDVLQDIIVGDIIWAKRYSTEEEKNNIPEGHREGPFIVIAKAKEGIYVSQGTSVAHDLEHNYFEIDKEDYNLYKDTHFRLKNFKLMDDKSVIKLLGHLNINDEERLFKQLKKIYGIIINEIDSKKIVLPFQIGDVIIYKDRQFIIIDINEELTILDINNIKLKRKLDIDKVNKLDYSKMLKISKNSDIKFRGTVSDKVLNRVLCNKERYFKYLEDLKIIQRGSIIESKNKYYYIFGEEGQEWMTFELKKSGTNEIEINNITYYTDFKEIRLSKKKDYNILYLCNEEEKNNLKKLRKEYKYNKKHENKYSNLNIGDIVESKYYKKQRFIIISIHSKTYECISISKIRKAIFDPILIKKTDVILSKDTSVDGIKWLEYNPNFKMNEIGKQKNLDDIFTTQENFLSKEKDVSVEKELYLNRGSIVIYNNKKYYIYGEEGPSWMVFEIIEEFKDNYDILNIDGKDFYTCYRENLINKKEPLTTIYNCTLDEVDYIKSKRKDYRIKHNLIRTNKNIIKNIEIGSVVKSNEFSNEEFVVKQMIGDLLVCVSYVDRNMTTPTKHYFDKEKVLVIDKKRN